MKMVRIAAFLLSMLMVSTSALADRKTTRASINLSFGDETYTSDIEVSWEEQEDTFVILPLARADSFFLINKDGVRLRTTYSLTSAAKATMNESDPVQATRKYNVSGTIWYYITVKQGGKVCSGYICGQVLNNVSESTFIANGGNESAESISGETLGMIRITKDNVSVHEDNSTEAERITTVNKDDVFYYLGKSGGWYLIQSGYWINGDNVHVMTDSEVDDYVNSGDYSGKTYTQGDKETMVAWIQAALKTLDYYDGEVTGHYGMLTAEAVRLFQKDNGISADGVADPKTIARIMEVLNGAGSSTGAGDKTKPVYNVDWFNVMKQNNLITANMELTLTDISRNVSFKVKVQSTGNHADVEPLTAADTNVLCSLYGVTNAFQLGTQNKWQRRAVLVTNKMDQQFVGSIYAIPHGLNTISGNNFNGQFCLHFLGSTLYADTSDSMPAEDSHQAKIAVGVTELKSEGYTIQTTYP